MVFVSFKSYSFSGKLGDAYGGGQDFLREIFSCDGRAFNIEVNVTILNHYRQLPNGFDLFVHRSCPLLRVIRHVGAG